MTHLDLSSLAAYNSLSDPHLESYFSNERVRSHLKHAGLINHQGEIVKDGEYRSQLARREHRIHVRHMLAENIVNRAIDLERVRRSETRRQRDVLVKAAIVNNIKESKRRNGLLSDFMTHSADMDLFSANPSWSHDRPKSANYHPQTEMFDESSRFARGQSTHNGDEEPIQQSSKLLNRRHRRRPSGRRAKSSSAQRPRQLTKYPESSLPSSACQITMVYYGPHTKVDYDHLVFDDIDEIIVMQQHCGGENRIAFKDSLKTGDIFTFNSRRHLDYPFGLSLYVKGLIDSRISTCCEYKHRHGVRLGGERGHFAIKSVQGSKPCIKCRFEKEARLKKLAQSPKEKDDENSKSITIPMPLSNEPNRRRTPVQIPVRHTSISNDNYSEDFEGSDKDKLSVQNGYSTDGSNTHLNNKQQKSKSKHTKDKMPLRVTPVARRQSETSSDETPKKQTTKKTWQIIFHPSDKSSGDFGKLRSAKDLVLKLSLIGNNDESEPYQIDLRPLIDGSKSTRQNSFSIKLKNIGKPEEMRLKLQSTNNDIADPVKWHLDRIELIDPESQYRFQFPCQQPIELSKEKLLQLSQNSSREKEKQNESSDESLSQPTSSSRPKAETNSKKSSRSSISRKSLSDLDSVPPTPIRNPKEKSSFSSDTTAHENLIPYCVTIYPSDTNDGEFNPAANSRIFLRLNNEEKERNLFRKNDQQPCPTFQSGQQQTFEIDFTRNANEQPKTLTIGYVNQDITAGKWKLQKIILINRKTNEETIFTCDKDLIRNDLNHRAEQTYQTQTKIDDDQDTPRNEQDKKEIPISDTRSSTPIKTQNDSPGKKSPSIHSFLTMNDDDADYRTIFKQLDPNNELQTGSTPPSPNSKQDAQPKMPSQQNLTEERMKSPHVDPLVGLEDLHNQTARSNDPQQQKSLPITTNEGPFQKWYSENDEDDF